MAGWKGRRVVPKLEDLIAVHGKPGMSVRNNGTEPTSNAVPEYCGEARLEWHYRCQANQTRTCSSKALMVGRVTNCSTRICSAASPMPAKRFAISTKVYNTKRAYSSLGMQLRRRSLLTLKKLRSA